jgi:hypothetical protein
MFSFYAGCRSFMKNEDKGRCGDFSKTLNSNFVPEV